MSSFDVEALLDSVAEEQRLKKEKEAREQLQAERGERRDGSRDRNRGGGGRHKYSPPEPLSPGGKSHRLKSRGHPDSAEGDYHKPPGDYYRGGGRYHSRSRSRSPDRDRYYRPRGGRDDRERSGRGGRDRDYRRRSRSRGHRRSKSPALTEDERDRRTVFVQQLAARLRTKDLITFFEKVGKVQEAQIVKDRISGRSKGVGYVEFKNEESVPLAIQLTGQKLLNIPIIAQLTEAEKNRQARNTENTSSNSGIPYHRLYVGNIHFSVDETDIKNIFEPFGEIEFVQLQKDETGRSRGFGFVQFNDPAEAKEALEKMNGFDLAGRPIRVGLGNDKFTADSTAQLLSQNFQNKSQGSGFYGQGGRAAFGGGSHSFDRASNRNDKMAAGASALDDSDVAGVNFNNYSRDALMRKLARIDEPGDGPVDIRKIGFSRTDTKPQPQNIPQPSRCILLKNMFDPAK